MTHTSEKNSIHRPVFIHLVTKTVLAGLLLITAGLGFSAESRDLYLIKPAAFVGSYTLCIEQQVSYHRHALLVKNITRSRMRGTLVLDYGIGPQARQPLPGERRHKLPLGCAIKNNRFRFTVAVNIAGKIIKQRFQGTFIRLQGRSCIIGSCGPPRGPQRFFLAMASRR